MIGTLTIENKPFTEVRNIVVDGARINILSNPGVLGPSTLKITVETNLKNIEFLITRPLENED